MGGVTDGQKSFSYRARKIVNLRIFNNPENDKPWDKSVSDLGLEILCVSQVRASGCG